MTGGDNFCLRLNEFESDVKSFWKELQIEQDFTDVILATEDKQIKTHKIVLSSYSPVLKNILKINQNQQPFIYLRKVKHKDLQSVLTFMYQGEVNVAEEDLGTFLETAEDLQIRGLSESNLEGLNSNQNKDESSQYLAPQTSPSPKRKIGTEKINKGEVGSPSSQTYESSQFFTKSQNKSVRIMEGEENNQSIVLATELNKLICQKCDKQFTNRGNLYQHNKSIHEGVRYSCDQCNYKATTKGSLKAHIDSVHQTLSVNCEKCDKQFSNNTSLWHHNSTVHEGVRYPCEYCDYKATQRRLLRSHKSKQHKNELI